MYNNTPSKAIANTASNITYRPLIEAVDTGRCTLIIWPIFGTRLISFTYCISLTSHYCSNSGLFLRICSLFFCSWIIWTLTFYCFRLKNAFYLFLGFRVSNHCWSFQRLFWLSKLPSNHPATVTTLIYALISIFDSW